MILYGEAQYIDKFGKLHCEFRKGSRNLLHTRTHAIEGSKPLYNDRFVLVCSKAQIFAPHLTDDLKSILGMPVQVECDIKKYSFKDKIKREGWNLVASRISIDDVSHNS